MHQCHSLVRSIGHRTIGSVGLIGFSCALPALAHSREHDQTKQDNKAGPSRVDIGMDACFNTRCLGFSAAVVWCDEADCSLMLPNTACPTGWRGGGNVPSTDMTLFLVCALSAEADVPADESSCALRCSCFVDGSGPRSSRMLKSPHHSGGKEQSTTEIGRFA